MTADTYAATIKPLGNDSGYEIRIYSNGMYDRLCLLSWRQARKITRKAGYSNPDTGASLYAQKLMRELKEYNESYEALEARTWEVTL